MLGGIDLGKRKNTYIFAPEQKKGGNLGCLFTIVALIAAVVAAAILFNSAANDRMELRTEKVTVMALDKAYEGLTVLHISDLHAAAIGSDLNIWRSLLYGKTYHAVVMSGDMVGETGDYEPMLSLIHTLSQINATAPIYFVAGDDDPAPILSTPRGTPEVLADWVLAAQKAGAVYLDAPVSQQVGKKPRGLCPNTFMMWMQAACWAAFKSRRKPWRPRANSTTLRAAPPTARFATGSTRWSARQRRSK